VGGFLRRRTVRQAAEPPRLFFRPFWHRTKSKQQNPRQLAAAKRGDNAARKASEQILAMQKWAV
jgi:hypothetical protein